MRGNLVKIKCDYYQNARCLQALENQRNLVFGSILRRLKFDHSYFRCHWRYRLTQYHILKVSLVVLRRQVVLWCDSTFTSRYPILKTSILLHKRGLVKFHSGRTVTVDKNTAVDENYQVQATTIDLNTSLDIGRRPQKWF